MCKDRMKPGIDVISITNPWRTGWNVLTVGVREYITRRLRRYRRGISRTPWALIRPVLAARLRQSSPMPHPRALSTGLCKIALVITTRRRLAEARKATLMGLHSRGTWLGLSPLNYNVISVARCIFTTSAQCGGEIAAVAGAMIQLSSPPLWHSAHK